MSKRKINLERILLISVLSKVSNSVTQDDPLAMRIHLNDSREFIGYFSKVSFIDPETVEFVNEDGSILQTKLDEIKKVDIFRFKNSRRIAWFENELPQEISFEN